MLDVIGFNLADRPVSGEYLRVTFRAELTPLSSPNVIRELITRQLQEVENGFILGSGPSLPAASDTTFGFGFVFSDAVIRAVGWPRDYNTLLAPLRCFGGIIKCNIELVRAEMVRTIRAPSEAIEQAAEQAAPGKSTIRGLSALITIVAVAVIAFSVAPIVATLRRK